MFRSLYRSLDTQVAFCLLRNLYHVARLYLIRWNVDSAAVNQHPIVSNDLSGL